MQHDIKISCSISTTDSSVPLGLEIWLDNQQVFAQNQIIDTNMFELIMPDNEAEHELRFVMKNKTIEHTKVDSNGTIVSDACLTIKDLAFDEIELEHLFVEKASYTHDFNGTGNFVQEKFYGQMGCNGTVTLKFSSPIYIWLLENM